LVILKTILDFGFGLARGLPGQLLEFEKLFLKFGFFDTRFEFILFNIWHDIFYQKYLFLKIFLKTFQDCLNSLYIGMLITHKFH
jgi:hypothetical protein